MKKEIELTIRSNENTDGTFHYEVFASGKGREMSPTKIYNDISKAFVCAYDLHETLIYSEDLRPA